MYELPHGNVQGKEVCLEIVFDVPSCNSSAVRGTPLKKCSLVACTLRAAVLLQFMDDIDVLGYSVDNVLTNGDIINTYIVIPVRP